MIDIAMSQAILKHYKPSKAHGAAGRYYDIIINISGEGS